MARRILAFVAAVAVGLGLFLYPQAARWRHERTNAQTASQLAQTGASETAPVTEVIAAARAYNTALTEGPARRFSASAAETDDDYNAQLRIGDSDVMGEVIIPKIDVNLPFYHGTLDDTLLRGAGHVYGSSLPVGGASSHTVISAHSGLVEASMFVRLEELTEGDDFYLVAAGQTLRYVVDQVTVALPEETEYLDVVAGEDHATLLTCTPIGINTHRLLVRGIRAPLLPDAPIEAAVPFPWWAVWYGSGLAASGLLGWATTKRSARRAPRHGVRTAQRRPAVPTATVGALVCAALVLAPAPRASAMDLPWPVPQPLPSVSGTGTLTVTKRGKDGAAPGSTRFIVRPVTAIAGRPVNLSDPATWTTLRTFDVADLPQATVGAGTSVATDASGVANLQLATGLYVVSETTEVAQIANPSVRINTFLVTVPYPDAKQGSWQYQVSAAPKIHGPNQPDIPPVYRARPGGSRGLGGPIHGTGKRYPTTSNPLQNAVERTLSRSGGPLGIAVLAGTLLVAGAAARRRRRAGR